MPYWCVDAVDKFVTIAKKHELFSSLILLLLSVKSKICCLPCSQRGQTLNKMTSLGSPRRICYT